MMLAGEPALFKNDGRTEEDSNETKGGERDERNHQDGHKSLLSKILEPGTCRGGDHDHRPL
jgi:hypothetical protein